MELLIDDGFNIDTDIAVAGKGTLKVRYRPALREAVNEYFYQRDIAKGGKAITDAEWSLVQPHFVSWNATGKGGPLALTRETYARIPPAVCGAILGRILNGEPEPAGN